MARVVLLDQYAGLGGGQRILMDLARALRDAGHSVRVFLPGQGAAEARLREAAGSEDQSKTNRIVDDLSRRVTELENQFSRRARVMNGV